MGTNKKICLQLIVLFCILFFGILLFHHKLIEGFVEVTHHSSSSGSSGKSSGSSGSCTVS